MEINNMDKYIIGENSSGKTRKMLEEAKKSNAIVVCKHPLHMQNKANSYGIYGLKFISYEEMNMGVVDENNVAIDELGEFFKHRFGAELNSFTMTVD
jgi:3-deoxy-D-manno-octulosonic-acid transferase